MAGPLVDVEIRALPDAVFAAERAVLDHGGVLKTVERSAEGRATRGEKAEHLFGSPQPASARDQVEQADRLGEGGWARVGASVVTGGRQALGALHRDGYFCPSAVREWIGKDCGLVAHEVVVDGSRMEPMAGLANRSDAIVEAVRLATAKVAEQGSLVLCEAVAQIGKHE